MVRVRLRVKVMIRLRIRIRVPVIDYTPSIICSRAPFWNSSAAVRVERIRGVVFFAMIRYIN